MFSKIQQSFAFYHVRYGLPLKGDLQEDAEWGRCKVQGVWIQTDWICSASTSQGNLSMFLRLFCLLPQVLNKGKAIRIS